MRKVSLFIFHFNLNITFSTIYKPYRVLAYQSRVFTYDPKNWKTKFR